MGARGGGVDAERFSLSKAGWIVEEDEAREGL